MEHLLDRLVSRYEQGKCSRRELLAALGVLVAAVPGTAPVAVSAPPFRCRELNHVTLRVKDLSRSKVFYQKLLGVPVLREDKDTCRLGLGRGFLSLWQESAVDVDHWCVGVEPFTRTKASAKAEISQRGDTEELYVDDPDGRRKPYHHIARLPPARHRQCLDAVS